MQDADRPYSNPLPPQSEAFSEYKNAHEALESVARQVPNFGTEQVCDSFVYIIESLSRR